MTMARSPKYHSEPSVYKEWRYHSRREAQHAFELDLRQRAGEIASWESQVEIPLKANGQRICAYRADFVVHHADGRCVIEEVKGFETAEWKLKRRLLEATFLFDNPDIGLRVIR